MGFEERLEFHVSRIKDMHMEIVATCLLTTSMYPQYVVTAIDSCNIHIYQASISCYESDVYDSHGLVLLGHTDLYVSRGLR